MRCPVHRRIREPGQSLGPHGELLQPAYVALDRRPVDAGPALERAASRRRFGADHRLTSRQVRQGRGIAFGDTRWKSAPFRDGHGLIRPITGRPFAFSGILYPLTHPPSSRSGYRPCRAGAVGLTQLIEIEMRRGEAGLNSRWNIRVLPPAKTGPTVRPTSPFGCGLSASLAASE